jgi:hypothetical protein
MGMDDDAAEAEPEPETKEDNVPDTVLEEQANKNGESAEKTESGEDLGLKPDEE